MRKILFLILISLYSASAQTLIQSARLQSCKLGQPFSSSSDFTSGLSLWYIGDNVPGANNDPVSGWLDSSGNANDLSSAGTSLNPILKTSVANGHNAVEFDGVDDVLVDITLSPTVLGDANHATIMAVVKQTGGSIAANTILNWTNVDAFSLYGAFSGNIIFDDAFGSGTISKAQPANWGDGNFHLIEAYRNNTTSEILVDGNSLGTTATSGSFEQITPSSLQVGAYDVTGSLPFSGQIAEIREWPTFVSSSDRTVARSFLMTKYGISSGSACDSIATSNVKLYARLDEASGTRADTSGNGNNLSDSGSTGSAAAIISNGASFAGTTQLSAVNNSTLQCGGQDFSMSFWVNFNSVSGAQVLESKGNETLVWLSSGTLQFISNGGSGGAGATLSSSQTFSTGPWYHIVITFQNSNVEKIIYVNGVQKGTVNNSGGTFSSTSDNFFLGEYSGGGSFFLNGIMDEFMLTKTVLSPTDVANLYNSGAGCRPAGL